MAKSLVVRARTETKIRGHGGTIGQTAFTFGELGGDGHLELDASLSPIRARRASIAEFMAEFMAFCVFCFFDLLLCLLWAIVVPSSLENLIHVVFV